MSGSSQLDLLQPSTRGEVPVADQLAPEEIRVIPQVAERNSGGLI